MLTGTHPCDDPPKQDGKPSEMRHRRRQFLHCAVASACARTWMSCERVVGVLFSNTPPRLSTRVVQFKRLELQLLPHRTSSICARALREFIFSELPQHRQVFTFTSTSAPLNRAREENFSPWPRTLSPLPASYCITNSATNQHHSVRGSIQRELVEVMELQGSGCRTTFNIASRESRR